MTALKPLGSAQREISLRHSLFEEAIALVRNSAVGVLVTAIQVIAGSACRNFSPPGPFLHSGLRPHFKKGLAVVHLGAETARQTLELIAILMGCFLAVNFMLAQFINWLNARLSLKGYG